MRADELLEGGDLAGLGVEQADDRDVADVLDGVEALEGRDGQLAVQRQRILALDAVLVEVVDAVLADQEQAVVSRTDHEHADAGMVGQRLDEVGIELVDLLERHPLVLALK